MFAEIKATIAAASPFHQTENVDGSTDAEVRAAIEEFEDEGPTIVTDGGRERLPRFCPNDDEALKVRDEEPLEVECPECGYTSARNLRGETVKICHKKASISENSRSENQAYVATVELGGIENRIALSREYVREEVSEEPELVTDGGEEVGEEEPVRFRDWSNIEEEREAAR